jgi:hypothetical protein
MEMKAIAVVLLLTVAGCGFSFTPKEITVWDAKGQTNTAYSCGTYMRVSTEGWGSSTFEVTFTDSDGLTHELYGVAQVNVSDIPSTVDAPMWEFTEPYVPGERYSNKADGTPGDLIKEGDIVVRGDNKARLVKGNWAPVKIPNTVCGKAIGSR